MDQIENLELKISKFLRLGVIVAGILMLSGWFYELLTIDKSLDSLRLYTQVSFLDSLNRSLEQKEWGTIISYSGLFTLISLPLIRVFLTAVLFIRQKERILAALAFFVFATLLFSFFLGIDL